MGRKSDFAALAERINKSISLAGGYEKVALASSIPKSTLQKYGTGVSEPRATALPVLATACGVDLFWLATGEGDMQGGLSSVKSEVSFVEGGVPRDAASANLSYVQVHDVAASAGFGAKIFEEPSSAMIAFPAEFLRRATGGSINDLACIYAMGDSMEPDIRSGDLILIDRSVKEPRVDGIYVVSFDGDLLVKRVQRLGANTLVLKASNPAYDSIQVDLGKMGDLFRVIGRVTWVTRTL